MSKYIDSEVLKSEMVKYGFHSVDQTVSEFIEDLPASDVEEVVHCRDCRWFYDGIDSEGDRFYECQYFYVDMENGEEYCSKGRKNNEYE
jgi:hypothetical protein